MKTIDEVLENVTSGGKWEAKGNVLVMHERYGIDIEDLREEDAAYAARACNTWPELVKALEGLTTFSRELCEDTGISANYPSIQAARAALEAALKDSP